MNNRVIQLSKKSYKSIFQIIAVLLTMSGIFSFLLGFRSIDVNASLFSLILLLGFSTVGFLFLALGLKLSFLLMKKDFSEICYMEYIETDRVLYVHIPMLITITIDLEEIRYFKIINRNAYLEVNLTLVQYELDKTRTRVIKVELDEFEKLSRIKSTVDILKQGSKTERRQSDFWDEEGVDF